MKSKIFRCLVSLVMVFVIVLQNFSFNVDAATSYTNAKEFYESVEVGKKTKVEMYDGSIYYATKGKTAGSNVRLKYYTLGYDVTVSAGGTSLTFSVKRQTDEAITCVCSNG